MSNKPIFELIFGEDWERLPVVMRKHYANRPYSSDLTIVEGKLDVMCAGPIKALAWLFWLMRGIPPINEDDVQVSVCFKSDVHSKFFHFDRLFYFRTHKPYHFKSRMIQTKGNEVIEIMQSRLGWRMNYSWEEGRVKLTHKGYVLHVFGFFIPVPLTFLMGQGNAEEIAVDDDTFDMVVTINHPWWGKIYQYRGRFKMKESL